MKKLAAPLVVLVLVLAAGCGGDGDSNGSGGGSSSSGDGGTVPVNAPVTTSSLSPAEYAKQANAICEDATEKRFKDLSAYSKEHPGESQEELLAGAVGAVIIPSIEGEVEQLRKLGAPSGDEAEVQAILRTFALISATARKEGGESLQSPAVGLALVRARTAGRKYGLTACNFK